jgi:hypothetical protein
MPKNAQKTDSGPNRLWGIPSSLSPSGQYIAHSARPKKREKKERAWRTVYDFSPPDICAPSPCKRLQVLSRLCCAVLPVLL